MFILNKRIKPHKQSIRDKLFMRPVYSVCCLSDSCKFFSKLSHLFQEVGFGIFQLYGNSKFIVVSYTHIVGILQIGDRGRDSDDERSQSALSGAGSMR